MNPTKPVPEPDPFGSDDEIDDEVDDDASDESLSWADPPETSKVDPFESVDDDDETDLSLHEHDGPAPANVVDDDEGDGFDTPPPPGELDDRIRVPLHTEVVVVVRGKTLPATLDPVAPGSTWVGGPASSDGHEQVLWLDRLTIRVPLATQPGDEERIVLGYDALAGKVLIEV